MRKLSPVAQEDLCKHCMAAVFDGMPNDEAAELFGVSTKSIGNWRAKIEDSDLDGLDSGKPARPVGARRYLTDSEEAAIRQAIINYNPDALELDGVLWTKPKIGLVIKHHYGVTFSSGGLTNVMRRLGLSLQRPDRRARKAAPETTEKWRREDYPAIRKRAKAEGADVYFGNQVGVRNDHLGGRTWAERGHDSRP